MGVVSLILLYLTYPFSACVFLEVKDRVGCQGSRLALKRVSADVLPNEVLVAERILLGHWLEV